MMSGTIEIKKSTGLTISIGIMVTLCAFLFGIGAWASDVNARLLRNEQDIQSLGPKIERLNENLVTTNQNVVKLQVLIEQLMQ